MGRTKTPKENQNILFSFYLKFNKKSNKKDISGSTLIKYTESILQALESFIK